MTDMHSGYIFDPERAEEMFRLRFQGEYFTRRTGLLSDIDPEQVHVMADLACGTGDYLLALTEKHKHIKGIGVDISQRMLSYCQAQAVDEPRLSFRRMDITKPLEFEDNSLHMVNARLIISVLDKYSWLPLLKEVFRVLRPGGYVRLVEADVLSTSNSPALDQFHHLEQLALHDRGKIPSPYSHGIAPYLPIFLRDAGFASIKRQSWLADTSYHDKEGHKYARDVYVELFDKMRPLSVPKFISSEEYEQIVNNAKRDLNSRDFVSMAYIWGFVGEKPR